MKVLIIQQKMIGDVLASSMLFEAIKKRFPDYELHYLINTNTYPVVEHHPDIDTFHLFTKKHEKNKPKLLALAKLVKKEKFDVVIDVYSKLSSNIITFYSGSKIKISYDKGFNYLIYNHRFKYKSKADTTAGLAIENRLLLIQPLGISAKKVYRPKIHLTEDEKRDTKAFLIKNGIDLKKPLIMIGVLGSSHNKTYPSQYMAKVIDYIPEHLPKSQIIFNYIPSQKADAEHIYSLCNNKAQNQILFNVYGKGLRQFIGILSYCSALIGNEGGAVNMAKALDIPTFTIFSPWIKKEAWSMFDDGKKHVSVHLQDYDKRPYLDIKHHKTLKSQSEKLYNAFKPVYFQNKLSVFLKNMF